MPDVEILQVSDDEILCAFMLDVTGVAAENRDRIRAAWSDILMPECVQRLQVYLRNLEVNGY
jgi:hypothetical protein